MQSSWRSRATAVIARLPLLSLLLMLFIVAWRKDKGSLFIVAWRKDKGSFTPWPRQIPAPAKLQVVGRSTMPIKHGHFVYLVQARAKPCEFWLNVSRRLDTSLIWLTWKKELSSRPKTLASYVYFPRSTFAKGRNRLAEEAKKLEVKQGWRFNYFVFADEDMFNLRVVGNESVVTEHEHDKTAHTVNGYPRPIYAFNKLLNIYRPARAGSNKLDDNQRTFKPLKWRCVVHPTVDVALEAFHRTAADVLLPYNPKFDLFNTWLSAVIMNMKAEVFFHQSSVVFSSIQWTAKGKNALHQPYPRAPFPRSYQKLYHYFNMCWSKSPLAVKVRERYPTAGSFKRGQWFGVKVKEAANCIPAAKNVDYGFGKSPAYVRQRWINNSIPGCTMPS